VPINSAASARWFLTAFPFGTRLKTRFALGEILKESGALNMAVASSGARRANRLTS
jgi:hypothetical protein